MKNLLILGAGTGGTMLANRMRHRLAADWAISVVDPDRQHLYQPGLLFLPFGARDEAAMQRERKRTLRAGVRWVQRAVTAVEPDRRRVKLDDGALLDYDFLVIASGSRIRPELTEGLPGAGWRDTTHEFYTLEGAQALRAKLAAFRGGRVVVNIFEMPIKCPVAPMEFLFLADHFFKQRGVREQVELVFATPLDKAFTRPVCASVLGDMLGKRGIKLETEFVAGSVDGARGVLRSFDEREVPFDLLVAVPTHSGAEFIHESQLGNELDFVPTDKGTLQMKGQERIFVIGDATDLPSSKAGSVAHFQSEILEQNLAAAIAGRDLPARFDGHSNCFVESGAGKAMLIDFNYEVEPLPGTFPLPGLGPFTLLGESRINHFGKLGFRWVYWNALLPGRPLPIGPQMSMAGKHFPKETSHAGA
ncbi:MAG TPA: FAD/NAD(P)-binding oxidoreductase [Myxococcales bacterium]|nr:FAD/NAD(P)-binding oxidoreductase [Myxococcales bacterium]